MTRIAERPSREHGIVQATAHTRAGWTNDLVALTNEAVRLTPEGGDFALQYGVGIGTVPEWVAGWYPTYRTRSWKSEDAVIARGATAAESVARLLDQAGRLPR
jgi:hypothetical protein